MQWKRKSDTPGAAEYVIDVLNTFWRVFWSNTEQKNAN